MSNGGENGRWEEGISDNNGTEVTVPVVPICENN